MGFPYGWRLVCCSAAGCHIRAGGAAAAPAPAAQVPAAPAPAPAHAALTKLTSDVPDTVVVDAKTEEVIKGALKWLASQQDANGSWSSNGKEHPISVTSYVLMAYMASGNYPTGGEYARQVSNGVQFLLRNVREDGFINSFGPSGGGKRSNMYDHGIASIVLGEVYGQTQDPIIRKKLDLAIKLTIGCQGTTGGWRYDRAPRMPTFPSPFCKSWPCACTRMTGSMFRKAPSTAPVNFVKSCYDPPSGGFTYQPRNRQPGYARTAAAIYSLQVCGIYDDPEIATGSRYLQNLVGRTQEWFTYGSFYATPAEYMIGGDAWKQWYTKTSEFLLRNVESSGGTLKFWKGLDGNAVNVGPAYSTAVYTTILALPYHYLPLYQR